MTHFTRILIASKFPSSQMRPEAKCGMILVLVTQPEIKTLRKKSKQIKSHLTKSINPIHNLWPISPSSSGDASPLLHMLEKYWDSGFVLLHNIILLFIDGVEWELWKSFRLEISCTWDSNVDVINFHGTFRRCDEGWKEWGEKPQHACTLGIVSKSEP